MMKEPPTAQPLRVSCRLKFGTFGPMIGDNWDGRGLWNFLMAARKRALTNFSAVRLTRSDCPAADGPASHVDAVSDVAGNDSVGILSVADHKVLPDGIDLDTPLRLSDAVKIAFPRGGMTVSGLRREIKRNRLEFEEIAGKQFTTLAYIKLMRDRCRAKAKVPVSTSERSVGRVRVNLKSVQHGLSAMDPEMSPQDALRRKLEKLKVD